MSNKKQSKKESPVLLGFLDGEIEEDNDAYVTKLGGLPVWLDHNKPPSLKVCHCRICKEPMYLIFQSYAPLPDSPYHRVLYVWACNKRSCMRKDGSFSVVRSHLVDQKYLKAQRQKEEEKRKKEEKRKAAEEAAKKQAFGNGFQLGDLWGNSAGSFGKNNGGSFTGGFGMPSNTTGGFGMMKPTAASVVASTPFGAKKETKPEDQLIEQMQQLVIKDPVDLNTLPHFPGQYLYIDEERTDDYSALGIDMSRYQEYLDMEKELLMDVDENGETWHGETYEKQQLPRGVDKQFKKFSERVEFAPAQCVRYDFQGQPLFYSALRPLDQQLISSPCKYCGGPRVFEFQLMPNILSVLPISEYANQNEPSTQQQTKKSMDPKALLDSWSVGMEFGSVLVFVCQKDCHPGSIDDVAYMEETVLVQYETD